MYAFTRLYADFWHIIAVLIYGAYLKAYNYRRLMFISLFVKGFSQFLGIVTAERWNLKLGIPDLVVILIHEAINGSSNLMLYKLPFASLHI